MSKLKLDPELRAKLNGLNEQMEICDETGTVVGRFLPEPEYRKLIYCMAEAQCPPLSPEEIARRRVEPGGRTLTEILADLEKS